MVKFSLLLASLVLFVSAATAKTVDYKELEQTVDKMMTEFQIPGVAVGIVSKGKVEYMQGFGVRGVKEGKPVTPDTQFAIGSTSKAFTATVLGKLVEDKVIEWDAPIQKNYLPSFEMMDPNASKMVTVRDLLTHRTGLPRHDLVWYGTPLNRKEIFDRIKYLEPTAGLREQAQYQNIMYMTAGYLAGQVANTTWEKLVQETLLDPLEMHNTNFSVIDMQKSKDFALPHAAAEGKITEIPFRNIDAVGPAGSINSSIQDMGSWLQLQLNEGLHNGQRLLKKETLAEIHRPQMVSGILKGFEKFPEVGKEHYAMGWFEQTYQGTRLIHHGGGIDGFITFVGFVPEYDRAIVVFGNAGSLAPYFIAFSYFDLLIKGKAAPWAERLREINKKPETETEEAEPLDLPIKKYYGSYSHPAYGTIEVKASKSEQQILFDHYVVKQVLGYAGQHSFLPVDDKGKLLSSTNKQVEPVQFVVDPNSGEVAEMHFKADDKAAAIVFTKEN